MMADILGGAGLALALVVTLALCMRRPQIWQPLMAGFLARAGAASVHFWVRPLPDSVDALSFESMAAAWAGDRLTEAFAHWGEWGLSWTYSYVGAAIYTVVGRSGLLLQSFGVMAGVASVYLTYKLVLMVWGDRRAAGKAAWVAALFPLLVLYSAMTLREAFIVLLFLAALIHVVRWTQTGSLGAAAMAMVLFMLQVFLHAGIALAGMVFAGVVVFSMVRTALVRFGRGYIRVIPATVAVLTIGGLAVFWYRLVGAEIPYIGTLAGAVDVGLWIRFAEGQTVEGAAWPRWTLPSSIAGVAWVTPARMLYLLYAPFPWDVRAPIHVAGLIDGLMYLAITWWIIRNRAAIRGNRAALLMLVLLLPLVLAFAWGTGNFGTGMRHRAKFVLAMVVLAAPKLPRISFALPARHRPVAPVA